MQAKTTLLISLLLAGLASTPAHAHRGDEYRGERDHHVEARARDHAHRYRGHGHGHSRHHGWKHRKHKERHHTRRDRDYDGRVNGYFYKQTKRGIHLFHPRHHVRQFIPLSATATWDIRGDRIRVKDHGMVYVYGGPLFELQKQRPQHRQREARHRDEVRLGLLLDFLFGSGPHR